MSKFIELENHIKDNTKVCYTQDEGEMIKCEFIHFKDYNQTLYIISQLLLDIKKISTSDDLPVIDKKLGDLSISLNDLITKVEDVVKTIEAIKSNPVAEPVSVDLTPLTKKLALMEAKFDLLNNRMNVLELSK